MKYQCKVSLGLAVLVALAVLVPVDLQAQGMANALKRVVADHLTFCTPELEDPCEIWTSEPPSGDPPGSGGLTIYEKTMFIDASHNTAYVTISATGDTHRGSRSEFTAAINGVVCNPGGNPVGGSPPGWVTLQRHADYNVYGLAPGYGGEGGGGAGDVHDNSIYYTWCCKLPRPPADATGRLITATVGMASGPSPETGLSEIVFIEGVHFYVDVNKIKEENQCSDFDKPANGG